MEYIFGIMIIMVMGWVLFVGIGVEDPPPEKRKREEMPGEENVPMPGFDYKARYLRHMECIIQLQGHEKAALLWDERTGWQVQFDNDEKLYGKGTPFIDSISNALFEHDKFEKDPERYSIKNYCALPPPPQNASQFTIGGDE